MPVQTVAVHVEGNCVNQSVDGSDHLPAEKERTLAWAWAPLYQFYLLSVLGSRAVDDGQTAGDEVILDVHDDDGGPGADDLLDPAIPAVDKLLLAHAPVTRHVEDHEEITDHLGVHPGASDRVRICSPEI